MDTSGAKLNVRHIQLLVDIMKYNGAVLSVDRFGVKKKNYGPLAKISFEDMPEHLQKSALFAESDNCNGVSANIMFGQEAKCGTGYCYIIFDEKEFMNNIIQKHLICVFEYLPDCLLN